MIYLVPVVILSVFALALIKRIPLFDSMTESVEDTLKLMKSIFPYIVAIFIAIELFRISGLSQYVAKLLAVPLSYIGVPSELVELLILKPISGSGSLVALETIYKEYGADSYVGRVGSVISSSSDTIVYIVAVYFSTLKDRRSGPAIPISIVASIFGTMLACILCKYI